MGYVFCIDHRTAWYKFILARYNFFFCWSFFWARRSADLPLFYRTAWYKFILPPRDSMFSNFKKKCTNTILRGLNKTCSNKTCLNKTCSNKTCLDKTCSNKTCLNKKYLNKTCLNLVPTEGVLGFRGIETLLNHEKCFLFYKKHFSLNVF